MGTSKLFVSHERVTIAQILWHLARNSWAAMENAAEADGDDGESGHFKSWMVYPNGKK